MPLWNFYEKEGMVIFVCKFDILNIHIFFLVDNVILYVENKGREAASSCNAAAVIREFVPCADWAHINISGVDLLSEMNTIPYWMKDKMTGRPIRTISLLQEG